MTIRGNDISFWVDNNDTPQITDFKKMKENGSRFVFLRAGQNIWFDEDYIENFKQSKGIIPRGPYWFLDDRVDPKVQAEYFHSIIEEAGGLGELPYVIDLEKTSYWNGVDGKYANWHHWYVFINEMMNYYPGVRPIIYTGYYYWLEHLTGANEQNLAWFSKNCDLWIANYVNNHSDTYLKFYADNYLLIPKPFSSAIIWQYTGSGDGKSYGTESAGIDVNVWLGDEESFLKFVGDIPSPDPIDDDPVDEEDSVEEIPVDEGDSSEARTVRISAGSGLNIRKGPGTNYNKYAAVWSGHEVEISNESVHPDGSRWAKLENAYICLGYPDVPYVEEVDSTGAPLELPEETLAFEFRVPDDNGIYWQIGHDWESGYWNHEPRQIELRFKKKELAPTYALPETSLPLRDAFNAMSEPWQKFWFDLGKHFAPDMSDEEYRMAWISMTADTRAMTDNHAAENGFINYPSGKNLNDPVGKGPMQIKELAMGGNILREISRDGGRITVEAFDPASSPPTVKEAIENYPHLIMWATEIACPSANTGKWDGHAYTKPFPQIRDKNNLRTGVPYPLMGKDGKIVFDMNSLAGGKKRQSLFPIDNGVDYSPYERV